MPKFCNYTCHEHHRIGDRYCDGIVDKFYLINNITNCSEGFDEMHCPKRFRCKSGNKVSIDINQMCDGIQNCDNNEDENNCSNNNNRVFSTDKEMIANPVLRSCFWIMGFAVISGNSYVIVTTIKYLKTTKLNKSLKYQQIIVLNISIADFIMSIYLLVIAVFSSVYSGYYGQVDYEWRSSLRCSIIGSLAVVSSEASCLLMVLLTACRLYSICRPFSFLSTSTFRYKSTITFVWLLSFSLAFLPVLHQTSYYFVQNVRFFNRFTNTQVWNKIDITKFACCLANLINKTIIKNGKDWDSTRAFLSDNFPEYNPGEEFGYYSQTSVCMPRFYVAYDGDAWEYSVAIITVNFVSFLFIAVGYVLIYVRSSKSQLENRNRKQNQTTTNMQKRISRIIITDFLCWIPICIMAYVKLSGYYVDDIAYIVSAGLLLPINSAINPLLYSSLLDKLAKICQGISKN